MDCGMVVSEFKAQSRYYDIIRFIKSIKSLFPTDKNYII